MTIFQVRRGEWEQWVLGIAVQIPELDGPVPSEPCEHDCDVNLYPLIYADAKSGGVKVVLLTP